MLEASQRNQDNIKYNKDPKNAVKIMRFPFQSPDNSEGNIETPHCQPTHQNIQVYRHNKVYDYIGRLFRF